VDPTARSVADPSASPPFGSELLLMHMRSPLPISGGRSQAGGVGGAGAGAEPRGGSTPGGSKPKGRLGMDQPCCWLWNPCFKCISRYAICYSPVGYTLTCEAITHA
jgi:hypothetical protein